MRVSGRSTSYTRYSYMLHVSRGRLVRVTLLLLLRAVPQSVAGSPPEADATLEALLDAATRLICTPTALSLH